ncbi:MAG: hypothetical protein IPO90_09610 [Flavobacteriales bacterium]|nr:hypothetical protein [Flavobacteriales bacterium]
MRSLFYTLLLLVLLPASTIAQNWGIGFRLGDPSGISIKKYNGNKAFELSIGRTHFFSDNYYSHAYDRWYDGKHFKYKDHQLLAYRSSIPIGIQFHYLIHKDIAKAVGLQWYYGFGAQLRAQTYRFDYRYKLENENDWYVAYDERATNIDLGLDGVIGLEYKMKDAPVSFFLDGTLYMELYDEPFVFWPQAGIGARFRF